MAKMGRPPKPVDWKIFEQLCHIQCTHDELASFFHISKSTLYDKVLIEYEEDFPTIYKRYSEGGKSSLRRKQFHLADKNAAMAIWLGKQWLGQKEPEIEHNYNNPTQEMKVLISDVKKLNDRSQTQPQADQKH